MIVDQAPWTAARKRLHEALTLVVGRQRVQREVGSGGNAAQMDFEIQKVKLRADVAEVLRGICAEALDQIEGSEKVGYDVDPELSANQVFVIDDERSLTELGAFRRAAEDASTADPISPGELDSQLQFYAVVVGDQSRVAFVRKADPRMHHKGGRFLVTGRERLTVLEGPVFGFATNFDFVVGTDWAAILSQHRFELLFKETGLVASHVTEWVTGVTDHLPMPDDSVAALQAAALRDSRLWRRLRAIHRRGHLRDVSIGDIKRYAKEVELDVDAVIENDQLIYDSTKRFTIIHLLNEDLFRGPMTKEVFEAQRKASAESA